MRRIESILYGGLTLLTLAATTPREIKWDTDMLGIDRSEPRVWYSLVAVGAFRGEFSSVSASVRDKWIRSHPDASVIPVFEYPGTERIAGSKIIMIWMVDKLENLNVELVRRGCVAADYMYVPAGTKLQVSPVRYQEFRRTIAAAEKMAKGERLGIWSEAEQSRNRTGD